ncbi:hypothetical protein [Rhodanobacter lindaniclasticus]
MSIIAAFLLFGMLDGVRTSFADVGKSAAGAERLQTGSKLSFIQLLPLSLQTKIASVPGVKDVAYANWFGGAYRTRTTRSSPSRSVRTTSTCTRRSSSRRPSARRSTTPAPACWSATCWRRSTTGRSATRSR